MYFYYGASRRLDRWLRCQLEVHMNHKFCIYEIKNLVDGKRYNGYTFNYEQRMESHLRLSEKSDKPLYMAIRKIGWNQFSKKVLETYTSIYYASDGERFWIARYQSNNPEFGYNLNEGGLDDRFIKKHQESLPQIVKKLRKENRARGFKKNASKWTRRRYIS